MGVLKESVDSPSHNLEFNLTSISRGEDGKWTAVIDIRGDIQVGDGRILPVASIVRVRTGRQSKYKPRSGQ